MSVYGNVYPGFITAILSDLLRLIIIVITVMVITSKEDEDANKEKEILKLIHKVTNLTENDDINGKMPCMENSDDEDTIQYAEKLHILLPR